MKACHRYGAKEGHSCYTARSVTYKNLDEGTLYFGVFYQKIALETSLNCVLLNFTVYGMAFTPWLWRRSLRCCERLLYIIGHIGGRVVGAVSCLCIRCVRLVILPAIQRVENFTGAFDESWQYSRIYCSRVYLKGTGRVKRHLFDSGSRTLDGCSMGIRWNHTHCLIRRSRNSLKV